MRVDMFRRVEVSGQFSWLVVPEGRQIPQEATNTDWEAIHQNVELGGSDARDAGLEVGNAEQQIDDKGYAITSVASLHDLGHTE